MNIFLAVLGLVSAAFIVLGITVRWLGGNLRLVDDWKKSATWLTTAAWGVVFALPSLWNEAIAAGAIEAVTVEGPFVWVMRGLAIVGAFSRIVSQREGLLPKKPDFGRH